MYVQHTNQVLIPVLIWQGEGFHRPADHDDVTELIRTEPELWRFLFYYQE